MTLGTSKRPPAFARRLSRRRRLEVVEVGERGGTDSLGHEVDGVKEVRESGRRERGRMAFTSSWSASERLERGRELGDLQMSGLLDDHWTPRWEEAAKDGLASKPGVVMEEGRGEKL